MIGPMLDNVIIDKVEKKFIPTGCGAGIPDPDVFKEEITNEHVCFPHTYKYILTSQ